ncbi:MAG: hypothetical protein ACJ8FZ_07965 [Bradyrhizobium sp.]|jgi:hypothetical protein
MDKNEKSPGSHSDELLDRLLAAIGKGDCNVFERHALVSELRDIQSAYSEMRQLPGPYRKLLRQFHKNTEKRQQLRKRLKPIHDDIVMAGWLRQCPDADEGDLRGTLQDHLSDTIDPAEIEAIEDQHIMFLIDRTSDYRKRRVRKRAVEPFLKFLEKHGIVSSKQLPRNRMMQAWFDWLGVEKKLRPTDPGIRTIARDLQKKSRRD